MKASVEDQTSVRHLFGVPIRAWTMEAVLELIDEVIKTKKHLLIGVVNAAKMVNMKRQPGLAKAVLSADIILADGAAVVLGCKMLGRSLPERVPGIDLMERMLERGKNRHYRVYLLGAKQDILDTVQEKINRDYPGVVVAGSHHGYFKSDDESQIADDIRQSRSDILFVAMTSPKKEEFQARYSEHMNVPVCHGVGGAFDVMAGKVKRAPERWQKLGLEWLYRVVQEPRRMWRRYLVTNSLFCLMLFGEMVGLYRPAKSPPLCQRDSEQMAS